MRCVGNGGWVVFSVVGELVMNVFGVCRISF